MAGGGGGHFSIIVLWTTDLPFAAAAAIFVSLYSTLGNERGDFLVEGLGDVDLGAAAVVILGAALDDGLAEIETLGDFGGARIDSSGSPGLSGSSCSAAVAGLTEGGSPKTGESKLALANAWRAGLSA
jgi:hypothetical protein